MVSAEDWAPHPQLLVSNAARAYLERTPDTKLSQKQVRRAVQIADVNDQRVSP